MALQLHHSGLFPDSSSSVTDLDNIFSSGSSGGRSGSSQGSTKSESSSDGEDDHIAELTRRMARCMFQDDHDLIPDFQEAQRLHEPKSSFKDDQRLRGTAFKHSNKAKGIEKRANVKQQASGHRGRMGNSAAYQSEFKQNSESRGSARFRFGKGQRRRLNPLSTLCQQQAHAGPGMRALFLGDSCSRSSSCGTGVFLPRGTGEPPNSSRKQGCATVLIPAKVLQALKSHFDRMGRFPPQHDALRSERKGILSEQLHRLRTERSGLRQEEEINLPSEWTY